MTYSRADLQRAAGLTHTPTDLTYDCRRAINGDGPRAYDWADKPHRLVYDLCSAVERLEAALVQCRGLYQVTHIHAAIDAALKRADHDCDDLIRRGDAAMTPEVRALVDAAHGVLPLVDCDVLGERDDASIGWHDNGKPIPVTFGQVRAFIAALAALRAGGDA